MQDYIIAINHYISTHQEWAGAIIFLFCFLESLLIIGLFVPATVILITTGALISTGTLSAWTILISGAIGAILGDMLSYYIGRWFGWEITRKYPFNNYRSFFIRARLFFKKYGVLSVFLGRFMGPIRSTIPTVAGIMGMPTLKFQLANITSGILWVPFMMSPGYIFGAGASAANSGNFALVVLILSVIAGAGLCIYFFLPRKPKGNHKTILLHKDDFNED